MIDGKYFVKVADFGLSKQTSGDYYRTDNKTMPVKWTAIEVIQYGLYSTKVKTLPLSLHIYIWMDGFHSIY